MRTASNHPNGNLRLVGVARGEVAWFSGLILLLCTDLVLRNVDADWPLAAVFAAWAAAFVLPTLVLYGRRRHRQHPR